MTDRKGKWIHCPICGHRMFLDIKGGFGIEIKCPSCKRIIRMTEKEWEIIRNKEGE